jgi:hypothetical protein
MPPDRVIATRSRGRARLAGGRATLALALLLAWPAVRTFAQAVTVRVAGDALHVRAPGFGFIKGEPLTRLRDGRSVRVDLALSVSGKPGAAAVAQTRRIFVLSYDLWEERFAVMEAGTPKRSISHVTAAGAEAWCIDQLSVPLGALGRDLPFWVRLEYRVLDGTGPSSADGESGYTLRWLIEALSRRHKTADLANSLEAGPLRLPQ